MRADTVIKRDGFRALFEKLGPVEAERFIALIKRDDFDYTEWRRDLFEEMSIDELSAKAMNFSKKIRGK
jgi:hypothetical protein